MLPLVPDDEARVRIARRIAKVFLDQERELVSILALVSQR
jgi:hypothetical protein